MIFRVEYHWYISTCYWPDRVHPHKLGQTQMVPAINFRPAVCYRKLSVYGWKTSSVGILHQRALVSLELPWSCLYLRWGGVVAMYICMCVCFFCAHSVSAWTNIQKSISLTSFLVGVKLPPDPGMKWFDFEKNHPRIRVGVLGVQNFVFMIEDRLKLKVKAKVTQIWVVWEFRKLSQIFDKSLKFLSTLLHIKFKNAKYHRITMLKI